MNHFRTAVLAAAACTAGISLAACSVTTAASPASSPASAGSTVSVSGPVGRFPIPQGAQVIDDSADNGHYSIVFGSVSPAEVSSFYATALPRAGYTIIRPAALLRGLRPSPGDLARRGPEINSTPLASPGTVASLFSLQGAHEIRVRPPRQFPC